MKDTEMKTETTTSLALRMVRLFWAPLEILDTLRSIDARLKRLESCVKENHRSHGARTYFTTGHWND